MAEKRDAPAGRMFFTDFDASDKARPTAASVADPSDDVLAFINAPFPTIHDIASSLEIDFEDDWGDAAPVEDKPIPLASSFEDDADYIPDIAPAANLPPPSDSAFSDTVAEEYPRADQQHPSRPTLEEYMTVFPASRTTGADTARDEPDEDEDFDILSALPPHFDLADEGVDRDGGLSPRHHVPPPRSRPYGGITRVENWFRPPESSEEGGPLRDRDWFEPPESTGGLHSRAREDRERGATRSADTETALDLFSDLDLDALWDEKVRGATQREGNEAASTRQVDMFADIDLESIWNEKQRRAREKSGISSPSGRNSPRSEYADTSRLPSRPDTTQILGADVLSGAAAQDMHPEPRPSAKPSIRREKTGKSSVPQNRDADTDALAFLDDLGDMVMRMDDRTAERKGKKTGSPKRHGKTELPNTLEELEIEHFLEEEGNPRDAIEDFEDDPMESVSPPPSRTDGEDDYLSAIDLDNLDTEVDDSVEAPVFDDSAIGDLAQGDVGQDHSDVDTREEDSDDAFEDFALLDDPSVSSDVEPPVIDDTAIVPMPGKGKRDISPASDPEPDTAPYTMPDSIHTDAEQPEEEAATESKADDEAASVALNPMDVFANMDDMDFSDDDGLDDEMRAALKEDGEPDRDLDEEPEEAETVGDPPPTTWIGKIKYIVVKYINKVVPETLAAKVTRTIAWHENWWFYCDIVAAIIASASLAVIISYYLWYRN